MFVPTCIRGSILYVSYGSMRMRIQMSRLNTSTNLNTYIGLKVSGTSSIFFFFFFFYKIRPNISNISSFDWWNAYDHSYYLLIWKSMMPSRYYQLTYRHIYFVHMHGNSYSFSRVLSHSGHTILKWSLTNKSWRSKVRRSKFESTELQATGYNIQNCIVEVWSCWLHT